MDRQHINACFVSYRHTRNDEAHEFVRVFVQSLRKFLAIELPSVPIFFDEDGVKVGTNFPREIPLQLCRSACMVLFFSPNHFDREYPYCTLEYHGMVSLERTRRQSHGDSIGNLDLVLPVIWSGPEYLPSEIGTKTDLLDVSNIVLPRDLKRRHEQEKIKRLAKAIAQRYRVQTRAGIFRDLEACRSFKLPSIEDISNWLADIDEKGTNATQNGIQSGVAARDAADPQDHRIAPSLEAIRKRCATDQKGAGRLAMELINRDVPFKAVGEVFSAALSVAQALLAESPAEGETLLNGLAGFVVRERYDEGRLLARLADTCRGGELFEAALGLDGRALEWSEHNLGKNHPATLETKEWVANDLQLLGESAAARSLRVEIVEARRDMAREISDSGDFRRARRLRARTYEIAKAAFGARDPLTIETHAEVDDE